MQDNYEATHTEITETILGCRFDVMNELGVGFLESVYKNALVVEEAVIVELKCCEKILLEHQAQTINYLKSSGVLVGLLVNFGKRKVAYKRLHHPDYPVTCDPVNPVFKNQEVPIY